MMVVASAGCVFGKDQDNTRWGAAALMRGKFHRGVCNRLLIGCSWMYFSKPQQRRGSEYLYILARTPTFLMRHGCRLTHFFGFLHLDRRSDDGSHTHAFPVPMHAYVGQAWAANWCVPGPHLLGNAFRLESRHLVRWDQSASQHDLTPFSLLRRHSQPLIALSSDFSSCTSSHSKSTANCSHQHNTLTPNLCYLSNVPLAIICSHNPLAGQGENSSPG